MFLVGTAQVGAFGGLRRGMSDARFCRKYAAKSNRNPTITLRVIPPPFGQGRFMGWGMEGGCVVEEGIGRLFWRGILLFGRGYCIIF